MVGRLVEQHQVGGSEQQLGEHQPRLLAAGEGPRGRAEVGGREAEAVEDLLDAVVDRVGVLVLEPVVELVVAARGPGAVGVVLGLGHLLGGLLQLALEVDERGEPRPATSISVWSGPKSGSCRSRLTRMPGRT